MKKDYVCFQRNKYRWMAESVLAIKSCYTLIWYRWTRTGIILKVEETGYAAE
jgi:hypothetical protein